MDGLCRSRYLQSLQKAALASTPLAGVVFPPYATQDSRFFAVESTR